MLFLDINVFHVMIKFQCEFLKNALKDCTHNRLFTVSKSYSWSFPLRLTVIHVMIKLKAKTSKVCFLSSNEIWAYKGKNCAVVQFSFSLLNIDATDIWIEITYLFEQFKLLAILINIQNESILLEFRVLHLIVKVENVNFL